MSTSFKVRVTNGTNQTIVGDYDDQLLIRELSARWFTSDWESATGIYIESQEGDSTGQIVEKGYNLGLCLARHRNMVTKVLAECSRLSAEAHGIGIITRNENFSAMQAGVIPHEAFELLELLHRAIRLMEMFEALGLNEVHVTVFWS